MACNHNNRCRYTHGFLCEDCGVFFPKDSPTYRSGELLSSIWMVLHNISADSVQKGGPPIDEVIAMANKIGIGQRHENYEDIIAEAEVLMKKYGVTSESASFVLR